MGLLQRLQYAIGFGDDYTSLGYEEMPLEEDNTDFYLDPHSSTEPLPSPGLAGRYSLGWSPDEMMLMTPRSFEEIPQAVMALRQRKSVILNLSLLEPDQAQRCADYVAGGVFAIDGHQERLDASFFLFTPSSVKISNYAPPGTPTAPDQPVSQVTNLAVSPPIV
jgi:cell division inhibitor SepF